MEHDATKNHKQSDIILQSLPIRNKAIFFLRMRELVNEF